MLRGDGLFESLRAVDGRPEGLDEHLARLERSAARLDLALPPASELRRVIGIAVGAWTGGAEAALTLVVTRGTDAGITWYVRAEPVSDASLAQREHGNAVVTLEQAPPGKAPWLLAGARTLSYGVNMAALRWARRQGADDVTRPAGRSRSLRVADTGRGAVLYPDRQRHRLCRRVRGVQRRLGHLMKLTSARLPLITAGVLALGALTGVAGAPPASAAAPSTRLCLEERSS